MVRRHPYFVFFEKGNEILDPHHHYASEKRELKFKIDQEIERESSFVKKWKITNVKKLIT